MSNPNKDILIWMNEEQYLEFRRLSYNHQRPMNFEARYLILREIENAKSKM